jgi:hypothetical protein
MAETVKIDIFADSSSIKELKQQLLEARNQLSGLDKDSEGFQNVARRAGELKDSIVDINEQVAIFASGSKFEQAGTALGQVKDNLMNLDFEGAAEKAKSLTTIISSISFSEATKGLSALGSTFLSLGKALLTNPLFLIPAAIVGIITSLGLLGPIIQGVTGLFKSLSQAVSDFLDYIGVTNTKLDELKEKQKAAKEESDKQTEAIRKESIAFVSLITRLKATNENSKERKTLIKEINKEYGTTLKNIKDETGFQNQLNLAVEEYIKQKYNEFNLKANEEKLVELFQKKGAATKEFNEQLRGLTDGYTLVDKANNKWQSDFDGTILTLGELRSKGQTYNKVMLDQEKIIRDVDAQILNIGKSSLQYSSTIKTAVVPTTEKQIELNNELANTLNTLTQKNKEYGLSETELLELENERNIALIEEQFLKSTDKDKDKQRTDALLQNEINYLTKKKELQDKQAKQDVENVQKVIDEIVEIYTKPVPPLVIGVDVEIPDEPIVDVLPEEFSAFDKLEARWFEIKNGIAKGNKEVIQGITDSAIKALQTVTSLMSNFNNLMNINDENRIKALEGNEEAQEKLRKKIFDRDKKLRIIQTVVDTASNVITSIRNSGGIPFGIPSGVAAAAAGALQIAAIAKTQYGGSTQNPTAPNSGSVTTSAQPSFQLFGNPNQANTVQASNNNTTQTINVNASVSVDEITKKQSKMVKIVESGTL